MNLADGFELLAAAPDGVSRLRKLVLSLAIQGRLVPQDRRDEPASALLNEIQRTKEALVTEGKLSRIQPFARIAETEKPFSIPEGWSWARFGEVSINRDGERVPVSSAEREKRQKIYDYYGASGVIDKIDGYLFDKTLLLIGEDGANLINRSTPIAFLASGKYWVNNHAHVVDTTHDMLMQYLCLFINAISLEPYITGTAQPKMNQAKLNSIVIALPPLREQARIIAKVEELMRLCDDLESRGGLEAEQHARLTATLFETLAESESTHALAEDWSRIASHFDLLLDRPEAVDVLEQTIVQLAVRGLLVTQNAKDEPVSDLIQRIRMAKDRSIARGEMKRDKPLPAIADDEKPFALPEGWDWVRFGDVVQISSGVTLGRKTPLKDPVSLPYLRVANVQRWHLVLSEVKDVIIDRTEIERFRLLRHDLLITEGGDWDKVGRTCLWRDEIDLCLHQNHIFKARGLVDEWSPQWAELFLNSPDARAYFASSAKQTTNLASINMSELKRCVFPTPPVAEQIRIVARVAELRQLCADLRARLTARQTCQGNFAATLVEQMAAAGPDEGRMEQAA
ncbi:restriction endonuclease subunit S [Cupriavidus sp. L7L]|uniref:restriction endonuclease subunit S n=1 Tax=Cupriavidus sp. L7L TaxID=2546443 RepID=UPI0010560472|nr:restriction endonuclease subunit S [Cupriavidus sp. L7L]TDF62066.1 restriction endonuclease subunit S [Cupriavidus sp. L7L]